MVTQAALEAGRMAFRQRRWAAACRELAAADEARTLPPDDVERLAVAAYLVGDDAASDAAWARGHHEHGRRGDAAGAARCAFWLGFGLLLRGEMAPAAGWLARAERVLDADGCDCVERGFLLVPAALAHLMAGEVDEALTSAGDAMAIGARFDDAELSTLGRLSRGQALVLAGRHADGVAELDELMVAVTADEVSPVVAGLAYCAVIEVCHVTFDLRRAREWTALLSAWCDAQPDLVPYRGQCLVHRAEILQVHGAWPDAIAEVGRACEQLSRPPGHPALGEALYRQAELLRLRGEIERADDAYRRAGELGREPQPGLALLRLVQGRTEAASAAIGRAVAEATDPMTRAQLLAAGVEIQLAAGRLDAARAAAGELNAVASTTGVSVLQAVASHASGLVHLADGEPADALAALRPAWVTWRDLGAPFEAARVRVDVGRACRELGDEDGARMELRAAAGVFRDLGARTDLERAERLLTPTTSGGLTGREREVLALVATGRTNREVAAELVISEKTVARHLSNIFTKLGVPSRSAATAYAYEHRLVGGGGDYTG